jgi:Transcriptional regulator, contains sigma factor-related N-terminal domain
MRERCNHTEHQRVANAPSAGGYMDPKKTKLLVTVARLHYEHGFSQEQIAKRLDLSRPYISKLLNEAKEEGIVTVRVNDPGSVQTALEERVCARFGLSKAIVVPSIEGEEAEFGVGHAAAGYIESLVENGSVIGIAWGKTMRILSRLLQRQSELRDVIVLQLCGGSCNLKHDTYATEILLNFAKAFAATPLMLPLPAVMENKLIKSIVYQDGSIKQVLEYGTKLDIAVFTVGAFGPHSALLRSGFLSMEEMDRLHALGAVGDVSSHIINGEGAICDEELEERTIAIPFEHIQSARERICVAVGSHKAECIAAALKQGRMNTLITDEKTIHEVFDIAG